MASIAASLAQALPKPRYTGEDEEVPVHAQQRGPRIVGPGQIDESQIVLRRSGPPSYGQRTGWRPREQEDFGDGGAFPEIPVAQYPLGMGQKGSSTSNALAIQVNADGKVKYDAIAKQVNCTVPGFFTLHMIITSDFRGTATTELYIPPSRILSLFDSAQMLGKSI
jgi:SNW domain-containing protein 1